MNIQINGKCENIENSSHTPRAFASVIVNVAEEFYHIADKNWIKNHEFYHGFAIKYDDSVLTSV